MVSSGGQRFLQIGLLGSLAIIIATAVAVAAMGDSGSDAALPPALEETMAGATSTPTPSPTAEPSPTATPTPTTPPQPEVAAECFEERDAAPADMVLQPARAGSLFQRCQVVAFYGHPLVASMGALGADDPETMIARLKAQAEDYEASNGGRKVVPALHLITAVAQRSAGDDGTYLLRMDDDMLQEWIGYAEEHDLLMIIDLQMGMSTVDEEVGRVLEYLRNPRVHLALDPEWAMRASGALPGDVVGSMNASEINEAQEMLQELVEEHNLDNQVLVIHQFQEQMIRDKELLGTYPNVDLVIHTDGFGPRNTKIGAYTRFVQDDGAAHGGFKLFFDWDTDFMPPEAVNGLTPQPDVITFQ